VRIQKGTKNMLIQNMKMEPKHENGTKTCYIIILIFEIGKKIVFKKVLKKFQKSFKRQKMFKKLDFLKSLKSLKR
jgi:hypothetical protein